MDYIRFPDLPSAEDFLRRRKFRFQGAPNRWCKAVADGKEFARIVRTSGVSPVIIVHS